MRQYFVTYPLFEILANLVIELEALLKVLKLVVVNVAFFKRVVVWRLWRRKEIEEAFYGMCLLHEARTVRVFVSLLLDLKRFGQVLLVFPVRVSGRDNMGGHRDAEADGVLTTSSAWHATQQRNAEYKQNGEGDQFDVDCWWAQSKRWTDAYHWIVQPSARL